MFAPLRLAFAFLTRLPVPAGSATPSQLGASVAFFPLVGLVLGGAQLLMFTFLPAGFDPLLAGLALVTLGAVLTGAFHLDGLADVFDGLGGGRGDRARMLEIMRDPRIGAHGATALVLVLLGKVLASAALVEHAAWSALWLAPVCARFAVVLLIRAFPYARETGLGRSFRDHTTLRHVLVAALTTLAAVGGAGTSLIVPAAAALGVAFALASWVHLRAGGLTGDAYGAALELSELTLLMAARFA